ncbi:hypothetical protein Glove_217g231 [Diversispora epigaea]|uniref:Uncharacterized protein n=1 Tax=Diversispora epigaea TaxID=1348612 RepID=A0A397IN28_9GLOM|nr:hypothetical protein Glove_217g231 [Diversispora epigaea]
MENVSGRARRSTANYGTRYSDLNATKRILKQKVPSIISYWYRKPSFLLIKRNTPEYPRKSLQRAGAEKLKLNATASSSTSYKANETAGTNTFDMELSLTKENLLNQDKLVEVNPDTSYQINNNTEDNIKGKGKEAEDNTTDVNTTATDGKDARAGTDDTESVNSEDSFLSEHEEWRKKINLQKYKVWIKTKINKCILQYIWEKKDVENACKIEIEGIQGNDRPTLTRAAISQNRTNNNENGVKFWDIPIHMQEQEFKSMIKNRFGNVTLCSISTRGVWSFAVAHFEKLETADNLLLEWSQIVGEESCRVTTPTCNFTELKERGKYAVKIINLPPDITACELYNIISPLGAKTCYFPRNLYGKKKRMALPPLEQVIGFEWIAGEFKVKIVDTTTKTCHICHTEDHLVIDCPVAQKQKEISERKARDFERYGHLYKRQRSQLYRSLAEGFNMGTEYADAVKRNTNRRAKNTAIENNDPTNKNMMNILLEIRQDIQDLKEQMKDIDERLELVEGHCAYELLNEEEVEEMETSDTENEEENVEKLKLKSNNKERIRKWKKQLIIFMKRLNHCWMTIKKHRQS